MARRRIFPAMLVAGSLLLLLPLAVIPLAASAEQPVQVTTDSSAYCQELAARFAGQGPDVPDTARTLAIEGLQLCRNGHTRTGIAKLRRALRATQAKGG